MVRVDFQTCSKEEAPMPAKGRPQLRAACSHGLQICPVETHSSVLSWQQIYPHTVAVVQMYAASVDRRGCRSC